MIVHSVSLENFKSIGCYPENEVLIEPNITAIIGKNECGKSNILEGLSQINFLRRNNAAFSDDKKNRIASSTGPIRYIVTLKPTESDKANGMFEESSIVITKENAELFGGIQQFYL